VAVAALAIMLAVTVLGVGVDVVVSRHLRRSLDASLHRRAIAVAQLSASAPALLTRPGSLESSVGGGDTSVEVLDRHGRLVARSLGLGGRILPDAELARRVIDSGTPLYASAQAGGGIRMYVGPLADVGGAAAGGAVVVAASTRDLEDTVHALRAGVVISALAAALLGAAAVAVLLGRAFRPLTRLAEVAADIERTGDQRRRLPETGVDDEVGVLATTLNAMLGSLERSRDAERRFLADASHELRTPLTSLRGNVSYLARHGASPSLIEELEADADRLGRLTEDLLTVSREESLGLPDEVVHLEDVVRALAASDATVRLEIVSAGDVLGDRTSLERALGNLVTNAHRHGPDGGDVTVTLDREGGLAILVVADEGPGLAAADAERAFERFWRAEHDDSGSGLGLAIVRATVERHGGRVNAEGSRFTIELPALPESRRPAG
jgi:two-component system OmpR family sensor kinase